MSFARRCGLSSAALLFRASAASPAQEVPSSALRSVTDGMLVTSNDVTTCPYKLVGPVSINMRSHSYSLKELEPEYIAGKLRTRARKMGADAVVLVTIGKTHMTLTALRATPITGRAIKYADATCGPKG